jgi:polyisoprenoid-binding protein YceI
MRHRLFALLLLLPLAPGHVGAAAPDNLLIDTAQSQATFALRALWIKRIDGEFAHVEGVIERDPEARRFGVDVRIAAQSVRMERTENEDWARSPDFFDALRHPWIQFHARDQPAEVLRTGGEIEGQLTLRGITRPVRFVVEPSACERPGIECAVRARGEVERSEFGMTARRIVLGDRVKLEFAIRAHEHATRDAG